MVCLGFDVTAGSCSKAGWGFAAGLNSTEGLEFGVKMHGAKPGTPASNCIIFREKE